MRILLLSTSMGMGGADKQLLLAAEEMRRRGDEVLIVSLTPLGPMGLEGRNLGIPVESLGMRRGVPDPRGLVRLIRLINDWKPDIIHSHMIHANLLARAARLFARVPALVSTIHNIYEGGPAWMAAYRLTNRLVDGMTIVSEAAGDRFVRDNIVPRELLKVVPNGIDPDKFRDLPPTQRDSLRRALGVETEFVWLAVGRFQPAKDYPNLLRAFAQVQERFPASILLLVGEGPLQAENETLAGTLGLGGRVRFLGIRKDVPDLMSAADGFVMSSAWEGMPIVLLEAAAAGLPIVATLAGGNHEVVLDGESGFLVPPRDSGALGSAMLRLMELPETQRRNMGQRGRQHVQTEYGLKRVVDRWGELYREVLVRKGTGLAPVTPQTGGHR